jgi:xanthine dehydrogenase accessory factor
MLGYDVTIVDPRTAFASPERFPDVKVIAEWPDVALPPLGIDRYTAFVALTHDPKIDDPALTACAQERLLLHRRARLAEDACAPLERLKAAGRTDNDLGRIHAPIGLDIGAVSPAEIAVAIMGGDHPAAAAGAELKRQEDAAMKFGPVPPKERRAPPPSTPSARARWCSRRAP